MNQKTAKLLTKYAAQTNKKKKEVRRWWISLEWHKRHAERERIKKELAESG